MGKNDYLLTRQKKNASLEESMIAAKNSKNKGLEILPV